MLKTNLCTQKNDYGECVLVWHAVTGKRMTITQVYGGL